MKANRNNAKVIFPFIDSEKWINNQMISRRVNNFNLIEGLSNYIDCEDDSIEEIITKDKQIDDFDYVFVDFTDTKLLLFIFREQGYINKPFLIKLPVVFGELILITKMIPFLRKEDVIFAPSTFARDSFYKISKNINVHVINNSLNVEDIQKKIHFKQDCNNNLGYVGRIVPDKGVKELIECLPVLQETIPEIKLNILGSFNGNLDVPSKSEYFIELEELSKKLKVDHLITWHGCVTGIKKYEILSQCDIMINPGVFKGETFGVSNIDALSCGVPVICSNWTGFPEIITHDRNGYLVDVINNDEGYQINKQNLIKCILDLLGNSEKLFAFKKAARQDAWRFDHKKVHLQTKMLLKKNINISGDWDVIKDNKLSDYKGFYSDTFYQIVCQYNIQNIELKNLVENMLIDNDVLYRTFISLIESYRYENKKDFAELFSEEDLYNMIYLSEFLKEDLFLKKVKEEDQRQFFHYITNF